MDDDSELAELELEAELEADPVDDDSELAELEAEAELEADPVDDDSELAELLDDELALLLELLVLDCVAAVRD